MTDQTPVASSEAAKDRTSVAAVALSVEGLTDDLAAARKQIKALWVAFAVTIVLVVALAAFTVVPRLMFGGGFGNRAMRFQPGSGQGFQPGSGNAPQTTPGQ